MEFNKLRIFCAIVENKSFSKASEVLYLSQPTVSFQIKALEQVLGTTLLDRKGREVRTTESGEILYSYARKILQMADEAEQSIKQLKGLIKGEFVIGASTIPGEYILPLILTGFKQKYPGIQVNLLIGDTKEIVQKVADSRVEIGIVGTKTKNEKLEFSDFATEKLVLIAPYDCNWFKGESATIEELKKSPFVLREIGSGTRTAMRQKLYEAGVKETDLNIVMSLGSTAAVKRAVESGAGVSIVSEKAIEMRSS
jgi:DNA-binding transcriptional LysR family regulator